MLISTYYLYQGSIGLELRQLRYFLGVVDYGSVAAAARALHIAQPALSRQIAAIEKELGIRLLDRMPRGMKLTAAGLELALRAREIVTRAGQLKAQIALATLGHTGSLRIGVMPGYSWLPMLNHAMKSIGNNTPNIRYVIESHLSAEQVELIKKGKLDAGILAWRSPLDATLSGLTIYRDQVVVALPSSFAGAKKQGLRLSDLAQHNFIMFPRERSPQHFDDLKRAFALAGVQLCDKSASASDVPTIIGLVAAGVGFGIVPKSYRRHCPTGVVLRDVDDLDVHFKLELVWVKGNDDRLLENFIAAIQLYESASSRGKRQ
jgi:DNA-binding transcriptional LysR family regulator